jgi:myxalamid-type polyketide synthase MxaD
MSLAPIDNSELLRRALIALRTSNARLAALEDAGNEPIAIVGVGCRLPGGVRDLESYWRLLAAGEDAIVDVPADRWSTAAVEDPDLVARGSGVSRWGGFLDQVAGFDAEFFAISPRDAAHMDPQHRLFLEVAWEALERGGHSTRALAGIRAAVIVGMMNNDYARLLWPAPAHCDAYATTGFAPSLGVNRLSYFLDLRGPSVAVDSACSSSLVAVHHACMSLRQREVDMAIAGGVNLMLTPEPTISFSKFGMMSPDGRCRTFDARANGYVRGEGCAVVVLKRLADAVRDGDPVFALLLGSAVNQDGRSNGFTAPSAVAQQAVVRAALAQAGLTPGAVTYVEAHGTGTALGDPIEISALDAVYGAARDHGVPCAVGSVKTNFGHLEAAAGAAGLVKVVLALQHRHIPAHLHLEHLNPHIALEGRALTLGRHDEPWRASPAGRVGAVSSFGAGGTNAHVLLGEAPAPGLTSGLPTLAERRAAGEPAGYLLLLSARGQAALREFAQAMGSLLADETLEVADVCYTASARRSHHPHRLAITGYSRAQLQERLAAFLRGDLVPGIVHGQVATSRPRVVFAFPGQGSQWSGMARQLLAESAVFRDALAACDRAIYLELGESVLALLQQHPAPSRLDDIEVLQPVLFAIEVALAALWGSWGVTPAAVIGHSMGEVAAAHIAGALTLADAVAIICRRSRLLRRIAGQGAMAVVALSHADAERLLDGRRDRVSVAVSSSPSASVLSGDPIALAEILRELDLRGTFHRRIQVDVASHSPQVDGLRDDLLAELAELAPKRAELPLYSTVSARLEDGERLDADYWVNNLRQPVQFSTMVQRLIEDRYTGFVELSPHPVLLASIEEGLRFAGCDDGFLLASLRRDDNAWDSLLLGLGALHVSGIALDWHRIYPLGGRCVALPSYPWQRIHCWVDAVPEQASNLGRSSAVHQPRAGAEIGSMLGPMLRSSLQPSHRYWEVELSLDRFPYLADHRVRGVTVVPGVWWIELAREAVAGLLDGSIDGSIDGSMQLEDVKFAQALVLEPGLSWRVQLSAQTEQDGSHLIQLASQPSAQSSAPWIVHATLVARPARPSQRLADLVAVTHGQRREGGSFYAALAERGLEFGPLFRGIAAVTAQDGAATATMVATAAPALVQLDACLQVSLATLGAAHADATYLPVEVAVMRYSGAAIDNVHARLKRLHPDGSAEIDLLGCDAAGAPCLEVEALRLQPTQRGAGPWLSDAIYDRSWIAAPWSSAALAGGRWLVIADSGSIGAALAARLRVSGAACVVVQDGPELAELDGDRWTVRWRSAHAGEDLHALLPRLGALTGVVQVCTEGAWLDGADLPQNLMATVSLANAMAAITATPRLWLVTRGAHAVTAGERVIPAQQAISALLRVLAEEVPALRATLVDLALDPGAAQDQLADLALGELAQSEEEDVVAWRGDRQVLRLLRSRSVLMAPAPVQAGSVHLITGGLGGLGLALAEWLIGRGARHLVLIGRRPPTSEIEARLVHWRGLGVEVTACELDVADRGALADLLASMRTSGRPLTSVFHAAGVLDDVALVELDLGAVERVLAPKVAGAMHLHELTAADPLTAFVLFSSASALLGLPGQAAYAAANGFLDGLAQLRHSAGQPALSVNWGAWGEVGLAVRHDRAAHLHARGFSAMAPAEALDLLGRLLARPIQQSRPDALVMRLDVAAWRRASAAARAPLLAGLEDHQRVEPGLASSAAAVLAAPPGARGSALLAYLSAQVIEILRLPHGRIDPEQSLLSFGFDSLMTLALRTKIQRDLEIRLAPVAVLEHPTLHKLTRLLDGLLSDRLGDADRGGDSDQRVAELSDAEVDRLLRQALAR